MLLLQQQFAHPVYVVNGAIDSKIPDNRTWGRALEEDTVTKLLLEIAVNPALGYIISRTHPTFGPRILPAGQARQFICERGRTVHT